MAGQVVRVAPGGKLIPPMMAAPLMSRATCVPMRESAIVIVISRERYFGSAATDNTPCKARITYELENLFY